MTKRLNLSSDSGRRLLGVVAASIAFCAVASGPFASDVRAAPGSLIPERGRAPAVLRAVGPESDVGRSVQDAQRRTIRATLEPWRGLDRSNRSFVLRRFTAQGSLDYTFARMGHTSRYTFGHAGEDWRSKDPLVDASGRILVIGVLPGDDPFNNSSGFEIRRFSSNGRPDRTFSGDGVYRRTILNSSKSFHFELRDFALDSLDNIWLCGRSSTSSRDGTASAFAIAADGSGELAGSRLAFTVESSAYAACGGIAASGDGAVVAAGSDNRKIQIISRSGISTTGANADERSSFISEIVPAPDAGPQEIRVTGVELDSQGRTLLSALLAREQFPRRTRFWRLAPSGIVDLGFGVSGTTSLPFVVGNIWVEQTGEILAGGFLARSKRGALEVTPELSRLRPNGTRDPAWAKSGTLMARSLYGGFGDRLVIGSRNYFGPATSGTQKRSNAQFQRISLR